MSVSLLLDPFSTFWDNTGAALAGTLEFYQAGTSTPLDTFTDSTGAVANSNPLSLTAGRATVYGTDGTAYKIVLKDSSGSTLKTLDNVYTKEIDVISDSADTISALIALDGTVNENVTVYGYHSAGDGASKTYRWNASGDRAGHNGGSIIDPTRTFPSDWGNATQRAAWFTASTGTGTWELITPMVYARRTISAYDFGYKTDDSTDNYDSLNAAVGSLSTTGGTVIIPNGVGRTSELAIANNDITIRGEGWDSVLKGFSTASAASAIILITGDRCHVEDLWINQNNIVTGRSIRITSAADTVIRRVKASNCQQAFIRADGLITNLHVHECHMKDTKGFGVWIEDPDAGSSGLIVSGCYFKFTYGSGFGDGVEVNAPTNGFSNVVVSDNYFEGFYGDSANAGVGVGFAKVFNATVSGNLIQNCESDGIHIEDNSVGITVIGNTVYNVCQGSVSTSGGITVFTNSDNTTISGNTVRLTNNKPSFTTTSANGDFCRRLIITDNVFDKANTFSVSLDSVKDCIVSNNTIYEPNVSGSASIPAIRLTKLGTNVSLNIQIIGNIINDDPRSVRSVAASNSSCNYVFIHNNDFSNCATPQPDIGTGNEIHVRGNRLGTDAMNGSFSLTGGTTSTIVGNTNVYGINNISVFPLDAAAAGLGGVYVSARTIGGNFTLTHASAAGGETFGYRIE